MLHERAMLVKLNISQWTGRKKDKRITRETNSFYGASPTSGYYSKSLIEKNAVKSIQKIVNSTRTFHYENTLPWGDNGERLLPSKNYFDYTQKMREFNTEFDAVVKKFLDVYPSLITEAEYKLNKMFNRADYPDAFQIKQRYSFATEITPVPSGSDFRVDLAQDEVNAIQHQIEKQTRKAQADAMASLWQRLYDVVHKMADRLSEKDIIFRDSLVGNIKDLTDLLPNLNVTDDPDLDRLAKQVKQKLCKHTPVTLRHDKKIKADIAYEANAILETMGNYMGPHPTMEAA